MYRVGNKYNSNKISEQPTCLQRFLQLLLVAVLVFVYAGTASAARIGFNTVYKAVGSTYTSTSSTLTLYDPPVLLAGKNFYFTDHLSSTLFVSVGGNWHGFFEYYDNAGNLISIPGTIDHQDKTGSTSVALVFTTNAGERYLFIVPGYENLYTACNAGKISSSCGISTSSNSPDLNLIAAANPQVYVNVYSLPNFTTCINVAADFQTIYVTGQNLASDLTVTAPANFEVSLDSGGVYSSAVTLVPSAGTVPSTIVYVRLKSIATSGVYTGEITVTGTNIPNQNVSVSGEVYPSTAVTVSPSPSTLCAGTATTFSMTAEGANLIYQWQVSTDGGGSWMNLSNTGIYSGVNTSVLRLSSVLSASYSGYQYKAVVTGYCGADTSDSASLTVNSLPSIASSPANSSVCAGTATSFSVGAAASGINYQWQVSTDGGSTWTNTTDAGVYSGSNSATLSLSNAINASYNGYQYRAVVSGICSPSTTSDFAVLTINAAPATPGVISGYANICEYTNQSYSIIPVPGATSYAWSLPTDWTGTSGSNVINVVNSTYSGTISVTASNSCGTSAPATLYVTVAAGSAPTLNFTISNDAQCLSGNTFTFTNGSTAAPGTTISSTVWDFGDLASSTVTSPSHSYAVAKEYTVLLNVTADNGCASSVSKSLTVNPAPTGLISGSTSICSGNSVTLSVALTGTAPWTIVHSGSSTPVVVVSSPYTFTVSPSATTSYTISSLADANCSASAGDLSGTATVVVNANNPAAVLISSDAVGNSICFGTSVTFTASATNGGSNPAYQWLKNGINISGATADTYTTTTLADADKISVILTSNLATCLINSPATSNEIMVAVNPGAPATPPTIAGTQNQCAGLTNQTYHVTDVVNATSYFWSVPAGWTITSGQGTISITVTTGSASQNGVITVTATNGCGTSSPQILAVSVLSLDNIISLTSAIGTDSQTTCINSAITDITYATSGVDTVTFSGLPAGVNGRWSSNVATISGTPTVAGSYQYMILLTVGSCNESTAGSITVIAVNTVGAASFSPTVCINSPITDITHSTMGATGTGTPLGLPAGLTPAFTGNTLTISGTPTESGTFNYIIPLTGGCGAVNATGTIVVSAVLASVLIVSSDADNSICNATDITFTAHPTNGGPSPTYQWKLGNDNILGATNSTFTTSSLADSSEISVVMTSSATCAIGSPAISNIITTRVNPLPIPNITASGPNEFCNGGSVTLTAATATSYLWSTGATTQSITVATAGAYTATVTNAAGCSASSAPTLVTVNPLPSATITASGPTEFCNGGSVTLTAATAASYLWSTGATTQSITVTTAGAYIVTVTNAAGCSASSAPTFVTVNPLPSETITASGPTEFCKGGSVTLIATTANSYLWSTGATTQSITVTTAGAYTATVTNAAGCSASSAPTFVTVNPLPSATIAASGPTEFCNGGSVTLTAATAASYLWSTGATTQSITVATAGAYTVTVTNAAGCSKTNAAIITVNPIPAIPVVNNIGYCQNDPSSPLQAIPDGSNIIRWYQFASGGLAIATPSFNTLLPRVDSFYVTQTTIFGCESLRVPLIVTIHPLPVDSILTPIQNFICDGSFLTLSASNNYTYQWLNNGLPIAGASSSNYLAHLEGTYTFQMISQFGCKNRSSNSISIQLIKKPTADFSYVNRCINTPVRFLNTSNIVHSATVLWNWDFGNGTVGKLKEGLSSYQSIGKYNVTLSATPSVCPQLADTAKKVLTIEAPVPGIHYGAENVKANSPHLLNARKIGITYLWNPFTGLSNPSVQNPTTSLQADQVYTIRITNYAGCITQDTLLVRVFNDYGVFVPSGFSPDGDGVNDKLTPILIGIREVKSFRIFNRWGQLVYQTSEKNEGWNGTFKGMEQLSETYAWVIEVINEEGETIQKTGKSTLIR